jgi:hypothetical protein
LKNNDVVGANYGNYIEVTDIEGLPNIATHEQWNLYDSARGPSAQSVPGGVVKGTARIRAVTKNGSNYRYYLSDVTMGSGNSFRNTQSIGIDSDRWGNLVLENSKAVLKETADNDLLFPLPTIRPQALTDISLEVQRRFTGTATGGAVTISLSATDETFTNTSDWIVIVDSSGAVQPATFGAVGTQSMTISGLATGASTILAKVNKGTGAIRQKELKETTVTTTIDSDGSGLAYLDLSKADIYDVSRIRAVDSDGIDWTSVFTVDNGQRDNSYTPGRLLVKVTKLLQVVICSLDSSTFHMTPLAISLLLIVIQVK